MDRRGFLKGTFGGVAAGGLIIAAAPLDVVEFVEKVKKGDPMGVAIPHTMPGIGHAVFDSVGHAIGVIEDIDRGISVADVSRAGDPYRTVQPYGHPRVIYKVVAYGESEVMINGRQFLP